MELIQAIILGIVQGLTEFIPVSSSGHLVLVPWLLGWDTPGLVFDTTLHLGTLVAVVGYFWKDLSGILVNVIRDLGRGKPFDSTESRLGWYIIVATIPAVILGFLFQEQFEALFGAETFVAFFLLITGILLWVSEYLGRRERPLSSIGLIDAVLIGFAQALAITPGISRSGATISVGLLRGMERQAAARFSFLMMVPIVFGAGLLKLLDAIEVGLSGETTSLLVAGFIAAAISGYACIALLLKFLGTQSLRIFAIYCWLFGTLCLLVAWLR